MRRIPLTLFGLFLVLPAAVAAQEEEEEEGPPQVLSISSYQCPRSAVQEISENYDTRTRPIEDELVEEGLLVAAGLFFHAWADEWNVNYYRVVPDMNGLFDAIAEVGRRFEERYPELADGPGPFAQCPLHRDGIYFLGPTTQASAPEVAASGNGSQQPESR